jgi:hypothetical protein
MKPRQATWCYLLFGLLALNPARALADSLLPDGSTEELAAQPAPLVSQDLQRQGSCYAAYPYQLNLEQLAQLHASAAALRNTPAVAKHHAVQCRSQAQENANTYYLTEQTLTSEQLSPPNPAGAAMLGNGDGSAQMTPTVTAIPVGLSSMALTPALVNGVLLHR